MTLAFQPVVSTAVSSRPPQDVFQVIFLANQKDQAKKLLEKQAALIAQQQAKMDAGGLYFDPSHQVIRDFRTFRDFVIL